MKGEKKLVITIWVHFPQFLTYGADFWCKAILLDLKNTFGVHFDIGLFGLAKKEDIISFLFVVDKMASFPLIGCFYAYGNVFEIGYYL